MRALARSVKRQASRSGGFRPRMGVVVPAALEAPHLGLALAVALHEATRGLDVTVHVVIPEGGGWAVEVPRETLAKLARLGRVRLWRARLQVRRLPSTLRACIRFDRAWSALAARHLGAGAVGLPVTRTTATLAAVDALLRGEPWGLSEALEESVYIGGVAVAPLFYSVEGEAASALAAVEGLKAWGPCKPESLSWGPLMSVLHGRPELEFSPAKAIGLLAGQLRGMPRCRLCGGYTPRPGVCPDCAMTGLEAVEVEPLRGA